jgi:hypothetical protein
MVDHYWDVWLRTRKQRLAAFTALLMLALGLIIGHCAGIRACDYDQPHLHSEPTGTTSRASSFSRRIQVDSSVQATIFKTGTVELLKRRGIVIATEC